MFFISNITLFEKESMSKDKNISIDAETNINDYYENQSFLEQENTDFLGNQILDDTFNSALLEQNPNFLEEKKEIIKVSNHKKKKKRKAEKQTFEISSYAFFYSILVLCLTLGYLTYNLSNITLPLALIMLSISGVFFMMSFKSFHQKLVISKNNIYVFEKDKRIYTWNLINDYSTAYFKQGPIQKLFNCGNISIVNKDNKYLLIKNVYNVQEAFDNIIMNYEELLTNFGVEFESYFDQKDQHDKKHKNSSNAKVDIDRIETQTAFDFEQEQSKRKK